MSMTVELKQQVLSDYKIHEKDTGSPEVQIALLTKRIVGVDRTSCGRTRRTTRPAAGCSRWSASETAC